MHLMKVIDNLLSVNTNNLYSSIIGSVGNIHSNGRVVVRILGQPYLV